jgi:hypothetical protein
VQFVPLEIDVEGFHDMANMTTGAYELAKAGGKHHNWYREQQKNGIRQIRKGIASFEKRIAEHHEWIENPSLKVGNWESRDFRYQAGLLKHWRNDIERHYEFMDILRGVLLEQGHTDEQFLQNSIDRVD